MPQRFRLFTTVCTVAGVVAFGATLARPVRGTSGPMGEASAAAQGPSEWTVVNSNTDVDLRSVSAVSPRNIWAAGDAGTVLQWGGDNWDAWRPPAVDPVGPLNAIAMLGRADGWAFDGWAVGDDGAIYRWDGGSWVQAPSPTRAILTSLAMVSPTDGWAVGWNGAILHWDGIGWSLDGTAAAEGEALASVSMVASDDGWAVGWGSTILHWDGASWSKLDSPVSDDLTAVTAVSRDDAWAVGAGGVILHWDGETWAAVPSPTQQDLNAVDVEPAGGGWAVGQRGTILRWDGRSWTTAASPVEADLAAVAVASATDGCIVGRGGTILHRGSIGVTATPTRTSTSTRTPRPTSTITLTPTPGPSPTVTPTPTCPRDLSASLEMRLAPSTAMPGQQVTARFTSRNFGMAILRISLRMPGQDPIPHQWNGGFTSEVDVPFAAPSPPGRWTVSASSYGEAAVCIGGTITYVYGGLSANQATLTVVPATLYIPFAVAAGPRQDLTPPTVSAPTGTTPSPRSLRTRGATNSTSR